MEEPGPKPEPEEGEAPPDADPEAQPGFVPANGPNEHAHDEKLSTEIPEAVEADYTLKTDSEHHSSFNSNSEDNLKAQFPQIRKLSSKKGKDSRPTMTPRTDKPSDRVVRRHLSTESKEEKLEAKLAKAEKKGDEELEAKLEKKIKKLSKSESSSTTTDVSSSATMEAVKPVEDWVADVVDSTTPTTPTTEEVDLLLPAETTPREAGPKGASKETTKVMTNHTIPHHLKDSRKNNHTTNDHNN